MWLLIIFFCVLFCVFCVFDVQKPDNFPPGPLLLPIIGNLLSVYQSGAKALQQMSEKYGTVMGVRIGRSPNIVYVRGEDCLELLQKPETNGRSKDFIFQSRYMGFDNCGLTFNDGYCWELINNATTKFFNRITKTETFYDLVDRKTDKLGKVLKTAQILDRKSHVETVLFEIMLHFISGEVGSRNPKKLLDLLAEEETCQSCSNSMYHTPSLQFITPLWSGYNKLSRIQTDLWILLSEIVYDVKVNKIKTKDLSLIEQCLNDGFNENQVVGICRDILAASVGRTVNVALELLDNVANCVDVREKVLNEIKTSFKVGQENYVQNFQRLKYCHAVINETLRMSSATTETYQHRSVCRFQHGRHIIPENASLIFNLSSLHFSKENWKNPNQFQPERFQDGGPNKYFLPFGIGRRKCHGEDIARILLMFILINCVNAK